MSNEDNNQDDLYQCHEFEVGAGQEPVRIDKFIMNRVEKVSRNKIQIACRNGAVLVNNRAVKPNYMTRPLDKVSVTLLKPEGGSDRLLPDEIPLDIVYEDDDVMVINKQPGLVVHPGIGNKRGTLVNGLVHYFQNKELPVMEGNSNDRPGIVHRIDKDTSGLMVIAKTEAAVTGLAKQFFDHEIEREYIAVVWGDVDDLKGTIESNIGRHPTDRMQMYAYPTDSEEGKHAVTHWELVESLYYISVIKCRLETGRTHQIRVHMKSIGHTLFNDERYGGEKILKGTIFSKYRTFVENCFKLLPRQGLHAHTLGFVHPTTGEKMHFEQPLPEDMVSCIERWRDYLSSRK